jgi:hypothetical protein
VLRIDRFWGWMRGGRSGSTTRGCPTFGPLNLPFVLPQASFRCNRFVASVRHFSRLELAPSIGSVPSLLWLVTWIHWFGHSECPDQPCGLPNTFYMRALKHVTNRAFRLRCRNGDFSSLTPKVSKRYSAVPASCRPVQEYLYGYSSDLLQSSPNRLH